MDGRRVKDIRIVVSAVAPTPLRLKKAEAVVRGRTVTEELAWKAGRAAVQGATPLRDNGYKVRMLTACVAHSILDACKNAESR